MTPADHGYIQCVRCGTWRRAECVAPHPSVATAKEYCCLDMTWCSAQAGHGKGRLDADTGAPDAKRPPDDAWARTNVP